jgi:hypothetical protein
VSGQQLGRQRWLVPTVVLLVVLPVGGALNRGYASSRGDGRPALSREGSKSLGRVEQPLAFGAEPRSFVLTYRIERYDPTRVQVSTDKAEIRRPYDARVTSTIDGRITSVRASRFGALVISTGEGPRSLVSPPAPATSDVRLASALPGALDGKAAELREQRQVIGRRCQVYRVGTTVAAGELVPVGSKAGEHADICVDANGLLLEEVWVQSGRPLQRRVATALDLEVDLPDDRFTLPGEEALSIEQGNGFLREVEPESAFEGSAYRLGEPPAGFTYRGRYVVSPPKLSPFQSPLDDQGPSAEQVSMVDVWDRGPDLLVLSQTIAADAVAVPPEAEGSPVVDDVDLPIGKGATFLDLRSNEVRVALPEDRFLRLAGTRPPSDLVAILRSLRAETGTGLRFR